MAREISLEECRRFSEAFRAAKRPEDGPLQVTNMAPPGRDRKALYRMYEERDTSQLPQRNAEAVGAIDETVVVDQAAVRQALELPSGGREGPMAPLKTVTGHVKSEGRHRMLVAKRRNEEESGGAGDLAGEVTQELMGLAQHRDRQVAAAPFFGLDPELSVTRYRQRLLATRTPYTILVKPHFWVDHLVVSPDRALDVFEGSVKDLFIQHEPPDRLARLEMESLYEDPPEQRPSRSRRLREVLFRIPVDGKPAYFLTWPALSITAPERLTVALKNVERAARLCMDSPAARLRTHEFHHPHESRYRSILFIVDHGLEA